MGMTPEEAEEMALSAIADDQDEAELAAWVKASNDAFLESVIRGEGGYPHKARRAAKLERARRRREAAGQGAPDDPVEVAPVRLTPNQEAAALFVAEFERAGIACKARPTKAIKGREVRDGWMVNVRDNDTETGLVAVWWGRKHFEAYFEIVGHSDRTVEAAELFAAAMILARSKDA